jgi:cytoskeletal protein RodZ
MQDSVGRRLTKARLARGLSIEEVAHTTRIRPDKITALECGDYSRFGGNAYAKGFLLIYSRYLKVDASEETRLLEAPRSVSINDYQYLSHNDSPQPQESRSSSSSYRSQRPARPSALPLLVFTVLLAILAVGFYIFVTAKRLDNFKDLPPMQPPRSAPAQRPPAPSGTPPPAPAQQAVASPAPTPTAVQPSHSVTPPSSAPSQPVQPPASPDPAKLTPPLQPFQQNAPPR